MKAITISQPFASLIAEGKKWVENRSWQTPYTGELAIHAGVGTQYLTRKQLHQYPTGCIIATCKLFGWFSRDFIRCQAATAPDLKPITTSWSRHRTPQQNSEHEFEYTWSQIDKHEHCEGQFCWMLTDVRWVVPYLYCRGSLGLWQVTTDQYNELQTRLRIPDWRTAP